MQRTKLSDRTLPDYTKGEEIFNMVSHIAGAALGVAALVRSEEHTSELQSLY